MSMTNIVISGLIVALSVMYIVARYYRLQVADLRQELAEATAWIDPIQIGELDDDEL